MTAWGKYIAVALVSIALATAATSWALKRPEAPEALTLLVQIPRGPGAGAAKVLGAVSAAEAVGMLHLACAPANREMLAASVAANWRPATGTPESEP